MDKNKLSFADIERMITELAPPEVQEARSRAREERWCEVARKAARAKINRIFFRRYCIRAAGCTAVLGLLGGSLVLLLHDTPTAPPVATVEPPSAAVPAVVPVKQVDVQALRTGLPDDCRPEVHLSYGSRTRGGASYLGGCGVEALPVTF